MRMILHVDTIQQYCTMMNHGKHSAKNPKSDGFSLQTMEEFRGYHSDLTHRIGIAFWALCTLMQLENCSNRSSSQSNFQWHCLHYFAASKNSNKNYQQENTFFNSSKKKCKLVFVSSGLGTWTPNNFVWLHHLS